MKIKFLICFLALAPVFGLQAQEQKIGYTNAEYILTLLPEAKQIEADLSAYEKQLQSQLQSKYQEYQQKLSTYQANAASMIDAVRADKEQELQNMQEEIQRFQQNAESSMLNKRNQLLQPAVEKIGNAIKQVAEQNGFTHIFSAGTQVVDILLYASEDYNVTDLVLANLGIDPPTGN